MKRIFVLIVLAAALSVQAAAPPHGNDRLRELAVFPTMNLTFQLGMDFEGNMWVVNENENLSDEILRLRETLKQHPNDIKQLLRLGYLLDSNGETNESQSCYQKAEKLCRNKVAVNPQQGLNLTCLGAALDGLDKEAEAESVYRKATLLSSNEWRCWVGLGNFLENKPFRQLFPDNLRGQAFPTGKMPSQEVLDFRPSPDALKTSKASLVEASRCFYRALVLAPKEPEVFIQLSGYMSVSNWLKSFSRHFRDSEEISTNEWLLAFFSSESIANLQKAAELSPNNYRYISAAAYFEWYNATLRTQFPKLTIDILPDAARKSIRHAMTRLENLSEDSDKTIAAGASENLGCLNSLFENYQAAAVDFHRAVSLDPMREQSWDLWLSALLMNSASPNELIAVCESRLKHKESARNHLLLAKCLVKQNQWDEATKQAEIAGKLETNDIVSPLLIAAIALRQSDQTNYLAVAKINLTRAIAILGKMHNDDEGIERWRELSLNGAIYCALVNKPQMAIDSVNQVLKLFPNDETAKEILKNVSAN